MVQQIMEGRMREATQNKLCDKLQQEIVELRTQPSAVAAEWTKISS